jgi:hypothetical protein
MSCCVTAKQRFVLEWQEELKFGILEFLAAHPVFKLLPQADRENAAHCAATHGLLAIRSSSIEPIAVEMAS